MTRSAYYQEMKALALEARQRHGVITSSLGLREMRKVYKAEGITLDLWPHKLKKVRAAYFLEDGEPHVLLKKTMPMEPRLFAMAHELKHHLADQDLARTQRLECAVEFEARSQIEIGAEVFAAEFLFPEVEFLNWAGALVSKGACRPEDVVRLKRQCPAKVSYAYLVKRLEWLEFAGPGALHGQNYKKLEEQLYGEPEYKRIQAYRRARAARSASGL